MTPAPPELQRLISPAPSVTEVRLVVPCCAHCTMVIAEGAWFVYRDWAGRLYRVSDCVVQHGEPSGLLGRYCGPCSARAVREGTPCARCGTLRMGEHAKWVVCVVAGDYVRAMRLVDFDDEGGPLGPRLVEKGLCQICATATQRASQEAFVHPDALGCVKARDLTVPFVATGGA